MSKFDEIVEDPLDGEIGCILKELKALPTWTKVKKGVFGYLLDVLDQNGYIALAGRSRTYRVQRIGDSYIFLVSRDHEGPLEAFRGRRVRIICVGSGPFEKYMMAGVFRE